METISKPSAAEALGDRDEARLLAVVDREKGRAGERQLIAGRDPRLGERPAELLVDAHDLAGRLHLRPEKRVDSREALEREDRRLDEDRRRHRLADEADVGQRSPAITRQAMPTSGTPTALAMNGTVREARGLTSST